MQLVLTEDQELIATTAREFVAANSPVSRFRALRDADGRREPEALGPCASIRDDAAEDEAGEGEARHERCDHQGSRPHAVAEDESRLAEPDGLHGEGAGPGEEEHPIERGKGQRCCCSCHAASSLPQRGALGSAEHGRVGPRDSVSAARGGGARAMHLPHLLAGAALPAAVELPGGRHPRQSEIPAALPGGEGSRPVSAAAAAKGATRIP